ncbi:WD40/YVTN/BNR-like repeat-containing protein, partial [Acidobacteriota bacterium]
ISDIEALDDDFTKVIVGSASGGVWKSDNAGITWKSIFNTYGAASIGDVAIFQKDPNIIWVGTGEKNPRNSIAWGDGIYKSTDGGRTFQHMGLKDTHSIAKIITHPEDKDTVFVAAAGHLWGYTGDRGLFVTTNGGKTWKKLTNGLPNDKKTGAIELIIHPTDPDIMYVGFWQRLRQAYRFDSGGPNGGIFKTTDGGDSWKKLTKGLPEGDTGKIGLAVCRNKPDVLMAFVEHGYHPSERLPDGKENPEYKKMKKLGSGIYRSEDGGASWKYMNRYYNRPFYYNHIFLNPIDDKIVYVVTGGYLISFDGGKTLKRQNTGIHGDYHALWSDPNNKDRYYIGNDGGAALTHDHGKGYLFFDNLPVSQFYAIGADTRDPYYVYGGLQDNGSWGGPSNSRDSAGILTDHWFNIGGGDGFYTPVDPFDWTTVYSESQQGNIQRVDINTRRRKSIRPNKQNIINYDEHATEAILELQEKAGWGKDNPFRFNWNSPILPSSHYKGTLYFGGNFVFKSKDRGDSWEIISQDLTTQDPIKIDRETGGLTPDVTGAENHCSIITIAESPLNPEVLWAGTDDGNVQVTRNSGKSWTNVRANFNGVPDGIFVSRVETSHFDEGTCYVTFDGHRSDNFSPWIFKTTNFGKTWSSIAGNIPDGQVAYVIREDAINRSLLFVGTEFGLFVTLDGGKTWERFMNNLPTVAVHDILIHPISNDVIIGTHGRGIWICDNITPLQQMNASIKGAEAYLFEPQIATQWTSINRGGSRGQFLFRGQNPPRGAMLHYYLGEGKTDAVIKISDLKGDTTREIKLKGKPGINRLLWNFMFNPPELNDEEKQLVEEYAKVTSRDARMPILEKLAESLERR